jgi:hypothetical protein
MWRHDVFCSQMQAASPHNNLSFSTPQGRAILGAMIRQQKIVLAILAILDIAVIGAMGAYAVVTTRLQRVPGPVAGADPCVTAVLSALSNSNGTVFVAWSQAAAHIDVSQPAPAAEDPPAELIWGLLDRLPPELEDLCSTPTTVTLAVHTGAPRKQTQTAIIDGASLIGWLHGVLSDDELAAQVQYRIASAAPVP